MGKTFSKFVRLTQVKWSIYLPLAALLKDFQEVLTYKYYSMMVEHYSFMKWWLHSRLAGSSCLPCTVFIIARDSNCSPIFKVVVFYIKTVAMSI